MEDFLYVLLGILWIAFSAYQSSQKKKKRQQKAAAKTVTPTEVSAGEPVAQTPQKNWFDELFTDSPLEADSALVQEQNLAFEQHPTPPAMPNIASDMMPEEGLEAFSQYPKETLRIPGEETQPAFLAQYQDFDLRQAVILSEVLKAPYIHR